MITLQRNNKGIILPLSLIIFFLISAIATQLWFLTYYSEKQTDNLEAEIIAANSTQSALDRIRATRGPLSNTTNLTIEETFPSDNYSIPVKYQATIDHAIHLRLYLWQHNAWQAMADRTFPLTQ